MTVAATQNFRNGTLHTIVIDNGDTASGALNLGSTRVNAAGESRGSSQSLTLYIESPATLTNAIKIQTSVDGSTWKDLQSGGADIAIAAASAVQLAICGARFIRVLSAGAEGQADSFNVIGHAAV